MFKNLYQWSHSIRPVLYAVDVVAQELLDEDEGAAHEQEGASHGVELVHQASDPFGLKTGDNIC